MIDWFALLMPLAALPIVALFAFVGCQLIWGVDDYNYAFWPIVGLHYVDGFQTDVDNFTVTFQFVLDEGTTSSELTATETRANADISPAGEFIDKRTEVDLREQGAGDLNCTCIITKIGDPKPITKSNSQHYDGDPEDTYLNYFELVRDGDSFDVTVSLVSAGAGGP
jgi:hypothetical protein